MTPRRKAALGLHALAHEIATGERPVTGVRYYIPPAGSRLYPVPVLPEAVHDALCPSTAVNLTDEAEHVHVCDECKLAVEDAA